MTGWHPHPWLMLGLAVFATGCSATPKIDDGVDTDVVHTDSSVDPGFWRSALFPEDWDPSFTDDAGRFLHDFSYAGYHAGELPIPTTHPSPVLSVLDYGADATGSSDSSSAIQAAIDALNAGGTVLLPAGTYRLDGPVTVGVSSVLVTGEGPEDTYLHFTAEGSATAGITFVGAQPTDGEWPLQADGVNRSHSVTVTDSTGLSVGMPITIGWTITPEFIAEHEMQDTWVTFNGAWRPFFRRTITEISGPTVRFDVPLRYPSKVRDHASIRQDDGALTEVGLQDLSLSSRVDLDAALGTNRHHAVQLNRVTDGWIRDVHSYAPPGNEAHLQSGGLYLLDSRRVTITDCEMGQAQNRGSGGNGYLFEVSRSGEVLITDSVGRDGRHNFIQNWDFGTSGVVWLRTLSEGGTADNGLVALVGFSEFHHSLAMANLVDNSVTHDGWAAVNRRTYSSGAGHSATQSVFWNLIGTGQLHSAQWGDGYVIGTGPDLNVVSDPLSIDLIGGGYLTEPEDYTEGIGDAGSMAVGSLYEEQLRLRTGPTL